MINLQLPSWLGQAQITKLKTAAQNWWTKASDWMQWLLAQLDEFNCVQPILGLLAWERGIEPIEGESEAMFRARVKYAVANAEDAGSTVGLKAIFLRLGLRIIDVEERVEGLDWDIVNIDVEDGELAQNSAVLDKIIRTYGRTCRRYQYAISDVVDVPLAEFSGELESQHVFISDVAAICATDNSETTLTFFSGAFDNQIATFNDVPQISDSHAFSIFDQMFSGDFNHQIWTVNT